MRACLITTLLLLVAPGCNPPPPEAKAHASEAVAGSEGMVLSVDSVIRQPVTLHDDAFILGIVPYNIADASTTTQLADIPCLACVPMGETKELKDVLTELGLNDQHMANIQLSVMYRTLFISW